MKKTLSILSCVTILSACGTDNNPSIKDRKPPELNNIPQAVIKPQVRALPQSNYTALPFLGNSLIPAPPPVTQARIIPPEPPRPVQMVNANTDSTRRVPGTNRNASGVASADLLGPAPSPTVTRVPLAPLPPMAAPPAPKGPVQKLQSVSLNMPQGTVIPKAPAKNAKPLIEMPKQVAVAPAALPPASSNMPQGSTVPKAPAPEPASQPEIVNVAALPPVASNMPRGSMIPSAPAVAPAPEPEIVNVAALPPVASNMPQASLIPTAPIVVKVPEPEIRDVAALPPVAANMPQGSILPPVPAVAKAPEPDIHEVEQLQASSVIMPQGSYSVVPTVTEDTSPQPHVAASTAADTVQPMANTQVVVGGPAQEPKLVAQASDASVAERIPVEVVPAPVPSEIAAPAPPPPVTVASTSSAYDQYPNLADIPPAPPTPAPAALDPRVEQMKKELQAAQQAAPAAVAKAAEPKLTEPEFAHTPPPAEAIVAVAPAPAPVSEAAPAPVPALPAELLPKGPSFVVESNGTVENPPVDENKEAAAEEKAPAVPVAETAKIPNSGPGKPAGFLVPPTYVKPVQQTIHEGASTAIVPDNNFENIQPMSEDHNGVLPATRYERLREGQ